MKTTRTAASLTDALYTAARKAGFGSQLTNLQVEVEQSCDGTFVINWDSEVLEGEIDFDYQAILARAEKWLERMLASQK